MRRSRRLDFLIVAAVGVLVVVGAADSLRPRASAPVHAAALDPDRSEVPHVTFRPTRGQQVRAASEEWASRFARGAGGCAYMTEASCERLACEGLGVREIESCTRPTRAYRRTFEGAHVFDVAFRDHRAAARLSNGAVIELTGAGQWWLVQSVGAKAGRGFFESRERARRKVPPPYR